MREDTSPPARAPCCESDIVCAPGISRFLPPSSYVRDRQCWVASKRTYTLRRAQCTQTDTPSSKEPWTKVLTGQYGWPSVGKIFYFMEVFVDVLCWNWYSCLQHVQNCSNIAIYFTSLCNIIPLCYLTIINLIRTNTTFEQYTFFYYCVSTTCFGRSFDGHHVDDRSTWICTV